jgi:hypothetical protein
MTKLVWGEFNITDGSIQVQPKKWNHDHREWVLDTDAFPDSLRAVGSDVWKLPTCSSTAKERQKGGVAKTGKPKISPPDGWFILEPV